MTIRRNDLDAGRIDLCDVTTGQRLAPVHPGAILRDEFLEPLALSVYGLAGAIKTSRSRLNDIVLGRRTITTDTALRLARYFGMSDGFFLGLQVDYDLMQRRRQIAGDLDTIEPRAA